MRTERRRMSGRIGGKLHLWGWAADFGRDLRHGLRIWRHSPGSTAIALATLALGVAANVTVFSFVDVLFLKAPAVAHAERLGAVFRGHDFRFASPPLLY